MVRLAAGSKGNVGSRLFFFLWLFAFEYFFQKSGLKEALCIEIALYLLKMYTSITQLSNSCQECSSRHKNQNITAKLFAV